MNKKKVIKTSISIVILLSIWTIVTEMNLINSYVLPSPFKVVDSFFKMIQSHQGQSFPGSTSLQDYS